MCHTSTRKTHYVLYFQSKFHIKIRQIYSVYSMLCVFWGRLFMKLIILDRDGVINEDSDQYIKSADEFFPIPGSIEAIAKMSMAGFTLAVATNQAGIGRGLFDYRALEAIHKKLHSLVEKAGGKIHTIAYCPHHPNDNCQCRKPEPGLLWQIEKKLNMQVKDAWFVGDSLKDLQVAQRCGCRPALVLTGNGEKTRDLMLRDQRLQQIPVFDNLSVFADQLMMDS